MGEAKGFARGEGEAGHVRKRSRVEGRERRMRLLWTFERVWEIMQEASVWWMGSQCILSISVWRQIAIAISRWFCCED
jgi:hypothetical protein